MKELSKVLNIWYHANKGGPRPIERITFSELECVYQMACVLKTLGAQSLTMPSTEQPEFNIRVERDSR